ncbi:hypothetical protein GCM10027435_04270 [Haloparvum alkalitolerans]
MPDVPFADLEVFVVLKRLQSVVPPEHRIEDTDVVSGVEEFLDDVVPDVSSAACHEYAHSVRILLRVSKILPHSGIATSNHITLPE